MLDIIRSVLAECFALGCASRSVNYLDSFTLKPGSEDQVVQLIRPGRQKIIQVQHVHFSLTHWIENGCEIRVKLKCAQLMQKQASVYREK